MDTGTEPRNQVREWVVDALLAVALAAVSVAGAVTPDPSVKYQFADPNALLVVLTLAASLPLALRRRWPAPVLLITMSMAGLITALNWDTGVTATCPIFALYAVASWERRWWLALTCLATVYIEMGILTALQVPYFDSPQVVLSFLVFSVAFVFGRVSCRWRRHRDEALGRALEAERTRAAVAERAVFAERLRIARELHDVVSHTLSVIAVQSGVARHLLGPSRHDVVPALTAIEQASRTALEDLRRMLGVLRAGVMSDPESLEPSPGLAELERLAAAHRVAHGPVELSIDEAVTSASESLRLTAYRLVQESLTNVRKHAPGASVRVAVRARGGGVVTVEVDDDGTRPPVEGVPGDGYGLVGMRERVALFDGTLEAGRRSGGGFSVRASLNRGDARRAPT